jgi:hypothetical protein
MRKFKKSLAAAVLAFLVNSFCIVLLMSGGVFFGPLVYIGDWLLYPAMNVSVMLDVHIKSMLLSDMIFYLLGFLQFFIAFLIIVSIFDRFKHSTNN